MRAGASPAGNLAEAVRWLTMLGEAYEERGDFLGGNAFLLLSNLIRLSVLL